MTFDLDLESSADNYIQAVVFVGEDIYITSEQDPEAEKYPGSAKWHGSVFKCHVGVKGRKLYDAKISAP